ncbi:MAG: M23 family peptidase [Alphaproteobacteria bacterium]
MSGERDSAPRPATPPIAPGPVAPRLVPPLAGAKVRGRDAYGEGRFGARRDGGRRRHLGVDLVATPGELVLSPADGRLGPPIEPYPNDPAKRGRLTGVRILTDDGYQVRVLYVDGRAAGLGRLARVAAGRTPIGRAQDLSILYPPRAGGSMTNHIHLDVSKAGQFLDPTALVAPEPALAPPLG